MLYTKLIEDNLSFMFLHNNDCKRALLFPFKQKNILINALFGLRFPENLPIFMGAQHDEPLNSAIVTLKIPGSSMTEMWIILFSTMCHDPCFKCCHLDSCWAVRWLFYSLK